MKSAEKIIETGKWILQKNLTWGTSGNISVRSGDQIFITASKTRMGNLKEEDITICDINGKIISGKKPSKELEMHLNIYRKRSNVQAIVHASPFYSTMCACSKMDCKTNLFIESMYYGENMTTVPYFHAGSKELADAVANACKNTHVILMENHGVLVYDTNLSECQAALEVIENVCKMNILAQIGNIQLNEVPKTVVKDFLVGGYYKKRG